MTGPINQIRLARRGFGLAGVSPAQSQCLEIHETAVETPALQISAKGLDSVPRSGNKSCVTMSVHPSGPSE
jgi:hypothetical protein